MTDEEREVEVLRETVSLLLTIIEQFTIIDLPSAKKLKVQLAKIRLAMERGRDG